MKMRTSIDTIYDDVIGWLNKNLPPYLKYHSPEHTEYVFERSKYIAEKEGVSEEDIYLIQTAALFHDTGFVRQYADHEEVGCQLAREKLPEYGFHPDEIEKICGMIMATKIPQQPHNLNEEILADADLEYLATNLFEEVGDLLYEELKHFTPDLSRQKWNEIQIDFMSGHGYHTDYCKRYKEHRKIKNMEGLR